MPKFGTAHRLSLRNAQCSIIDAKGASKLQIAEEKQMSSPAKTLSQASIKAKLDRDQIEVKDWADFHRQLARMTDTSWIFRGVCAPEHYPIPSIGREKQNGVYKRAQEERLFRIFKDRAVALAPTNSFDDWQWLAYAQHVGVPTRLLDWSASPLIAAFFAISDDNEHDRLIFGVKYSIYIHEIESAGISPFDNKKEGRFTPPLLFDRLRWQRGPVHYTP